VKRRATRDHRPTRDAAPWIPPCFIQATRLLDEVNKQDLQEALDLLDLVVPTHLLHLTTEEQSVCVLAVLDVLPQPKELFHRVTSQ
jgi:hypothetical protein